MAAVGEAVTTLAGLLEEADVKQGSAFAGAYFRPTILQLQQQVDLLQRKVWLLLPVHLMLA